jgi:hypothetical protein
MAAGAWTVYNRAKRNIGAAALNLSSTAFRITLHTSASNANTATLSTYASLTNEVTSGNGYSSSGKALTSETWTAGASAAQIRFDADDVVWTGTGGSIANIKFAVVWISGASAGARKLFCRSQLTSSQFTLSSGNTLTLQMNASGLVTLT